MLPKRLDQNDNITNNNGTSFTSNAADQLTKAGASSLSYNSAGQATSVAGQSLTFAYNDQIKAITGQGLNAQYLYDGNGQRVQKTVNGVAQKFLWNGGSIAKEYKPDGSVRADYQLGAGAKIDGKWQFYLSDIQGSTLGVTDDTGKVIATWAYSDYGVTTQTSGDHGLYQPFLYTHSEMDAETGLYHNKARHYAPKYGKFLARDPIANNNLYSYCNGDPINFEDPSGRNPGILILLGIGAAAEAWDYATGTTEANQMWAQANDKVKVNGRMVSAGGVVEGTPRALRVATLAVGTIAEVGQVSLGAGGQVELRGLSEKGGVFTSTVNEAGGTVWTAERGISIKDIRPLVNSGMYHGEVNLITGVHGDIYGFVLEDLSFYKADLNEFGGYEGVNVYNYPDLTLDEITKLLTGKGTTIGGFCNSKAVLGI